ncbi:MAG: hypothetical protein Q8P56_00170 [Candidatus Uhrbacteria bacterium]|nr:hypothetical protein [Candidatus Uhrbacteria bacterium]
MDSSSIQRNKVLLIIITIFVQFHLPYFSLSPARAAAINTEDGRITADSSYNEDGTQVFAFNERKIPYLQSKNSDSGVKKDIKPRLLGIHIVAPAVTLKKVAVQQSGARIILVTAYSSTKDQTDSTPCTTANGFDVCANGAENVVAANFLPFGTKVQFPEYFGDREFVVQDRMHRRFSNRVDVWMKTRTAAKQFGVKHLKMVIVPEEVEKKKDAKAEQVAAAF